ncbi:MAG: hypothetical protein RIR51_1063 [Bacteroidota bacterium]|jgi:sterol desaturase/sphingolipid hydroxylase (fatty acid hydroxylase superfamily)
MKFEKIHNKGQARLFKSNYLEFFTKTHPLIIWGIYLPLIIFSFFYCHSIGYSWLTTCLVFISGLFFWSFAEYMLHRFAFHIIPDSELGKRISYIIHGNHHHYPKDRQRLFMPPLPSILLPSMIFGIIYLFLREWSFAFFPGFLFGYLLYGTMHYAIHSFNPPFPWLKPLWKNHYLHHYKDENKGFGVSSTFWDKIFGTMFDMNQKMDKSKIDELKF